VAGPIDSGGWGYITDDFRATMATAGLASLFLVFDIYHGKTPFSRKKPQTFAGGGAAEIHKASERGMDWLGKSKENKADGYYRHGIERAGVASGRKLSGGADGFARGALEILQAQARDGSITLGRWGGIPGGTAFCLPAADRAPLYTRTHFNTIGAR